MVKTLSALDRTVLEHVARYRLTTPGIVADAIRHAEGETPAAAVERLARQKHLYTGELLPGVPSTETYYSLAPRGAKALGRAPDSARPLKRDARLEAFAIARFCCSGLVKRHLFTRDEFIERFEGIWYPGQPIRYYAENDATGTPRLAYLKVDLDGAGRWDRLIDSCARFIRQRTDPYRAALENREKVETFARLLTRNRFQITVLTALSEKKRAIEIELANRTAAEAPVPPIEVHVVSGLFSLLCPELAPGT